MDDDTPAVSVVICAYTEKRWDDILAAVESLRAQDDSHTKFCLWLITTIPSSNAHVQRCLIFVRYPIVVSRVYLVREILGLPKATSPLIAFLDDDAMAAPDWLARLVRCCADPTILGVGGAVEPAWRGAIRRGSRPSFIGSSGAPIAVCRRRLLLCATSLVAAR